jgi:hypothetical protein
MVSEYSNVWIDMRHDNALNSAFSELDKSDLITQMGLTV